MWNGTANGAQHVPTVRCCSAGVRAQYCAGVTCHSAFCLCQCRTIPARSLRRCSRS